MKLIDKLAAVAASVTLAVTFLAAGLAVCAVPDFPARMFASAFSGADNPNTPFTNDELVDMAIATKHYSFDTHDAAELYATMWRINQQAVSDGRLNPTAPGVPRLEDISSEDESSLDAHVPSSGDASTSTQTPDISALAASFAKADERYALTPDAVSHLDDVFYVIDAVRWPLVIVGLFAIAAAAHVGVRAGRRALGSVFIAAGIGLVCALALLGAWALIDFNGFFAVFHSLFFAEGSWTFSWDSLLITALPLPFWMGMAGLWLGISALLCALSIAVGVKLRRRPRAH